MNIRLSPFVFLSIGAAPIVVVAWVAYFQNWNLPNDMRMAYAQTLSASCEGRIDMLPKGARRQFFTPSVSYRYHVNGVAYLSSRFSQYENYGFSKKSECLAAIAKFQKATESFPVFYSASRPAYSVITKERPGSAFELFLTVLFGSFIVAGIFHQRKLLRGGNKK